MENWQSQRTPTRTRTESLQNLNLTPLPIWPWGHETQAINDTEHNRAIPRSGVVRLTRTSVPEFQWRYRELHPSPRELRMRAFPLVETNLSPLRTFEKVSRNSTGPHWVSQDYFSFFITRLLIRSVFPAAGCRKVVRLPRVETTGFEPTTVSLQSCCSTNWSYVPKTLWRLPVP